MTEGTLTTLPMLTIGGSEAGAAAGLDPYRSRVNLWAEKTGIAPPREPNERMRWGTVLQPLIAEEVERHGYETMPAPADPLVSEQWPFMSGHLDGYCAENQGVLGVLEVKTTGIWRGPDWADDSAPIPYVCQVQHYLALTGLEWGLLACLVGGQRLELRRVERDEELIAMLVEAEQEFVALCEAGTPPPPDGFPATDEMLRRLYPQANAGEVVNLTAADYEQVKALREAKAARKAAEEYERSIQQALQMRLGTCELGLYEGRVVARWQTIVQHRRAQEAKEVTMRRFTVT